MNILLDQKGNEERTVRMKKDLGTGCPNEKKKVIYSFFL